MLFQNIYTQSADAIQENDDASTSEEVDQTSVAVRGVQDPARNIQWLIDRRALKNEAHMNPDCGVLGFRDSRCDYRPGIHLAKRSLKNEREWEENEGLADRGCRQDGEYMLQNKTKKSREEIRGRLKARDGGWIGRNEEGATSGS